MSFALRGARLFSARGLRAMQARGYAEEMSFTLAAANKVFYDNANIRQVDVPSFSGSFGILPKHVPTLAVLKPGVVTVYENDGTQKRVFVSSGTITVNEDSSVQVLAEELKTSMLLTCQPLVKFWHNHKVNYLQHQPTKWDYKAQKKLNWIFLNILFYFRLVLKLPSLLKSPKLLLKPLNKFPIMFHRMSLQLDPLIKFEMMK